ncbi:MAG: hypothetical protein AMXMBFR64_15150 [Myxococcales bacterium]
MLLPASSLAIWMARSLDRMSWSEGALRAGEARDAHALLASLSNDEWDHHEEQIEAWLSCRSLLSVGDGIALPNAIFW